ncbi:succinate dehydrogenase cytochrome b subunit [Crocinitomix algicola]|uniref:succinate dehydrogenase cytochrome b subunit n=1 Tax=Crocinitomix algicola TaxID=1740263 RepID=UPI000871CE96|nr:succinate dehydrogenase cytochrome b subunit [Crocinitomix algicola]
MKTSIARKVLMALSGFFLIVFLLQHFIINFTSVFGHGETFNSLSHFMGTSPMVQFVAQPILIFGVIFHLAMGMYLEAQNNKARNVKYVMNKPGENASWMSRNMIITGVMILLFLGLHFYDFWIPEIKTKFIDGDMSGALNGVEGTRYFHELQHKFVDVWRVIIYCLSFVFLSLHLLHGFQSAFQSVGFRNHKYLPTIKKLGNLYAVLIPAGFIFIALFHYLTQL